MGFPNYIEKITTNSEIALAICSIGTVAEGLMKTKLGSQKPRDTYLAKKKKSYLILISVEFL